MRGEGVGVEVGGVGVRTGCNGVVCCVGDGGGGGLRGGEPARNLLVCVGVLWIERRTGFDEGGGCAGLERGKVGEAMPTSR